MIIACFDEFIEIESVPNDWTIRRLITKLHDFMYLSRLDLCVEQFITERENIIERRVEKRTVIAEGEDEYDHDKVSSLQCVRAFVLD